VVCSLIIRSASSKRWSLSNRYETYRRFQCRGVLVGKLVLLSLVDATCDAQIPPINNIKNKIISLNKQFQQLTCCRGVHSLQIQCFCLCCW
jgi:hypothetical protein